MRSAICTAPSPFGIAPRCHAWSFQSATKASAGDHWMLHKGETRTEEGEERDTTAHFAGVEPTLMCMCTVSASFTGKVSQSVSQSVISRSRPALTPPPARSPAPPLTGKVFISSPRTPDRRTHRCKFDTARWPLDPLTTAIFDQPPGRAANRLAPPGRLYKRVPRRVLNKAHLHLGNLLPDPLRVAHLRRSCELLRVVYEERLGARARPSVGRRCSRARP